jgi:hypothetical protein
MTEGVALLACAGCRWPHSIMVRPCRMFCCGPA